MDYLLSKGLSPNVVTVRVDCTHDNEHWFLLRSDAHHDNPHCDQELEKKHLDEALACGAGILDNGDLFCAMQGKYDKRSDKSALRPEHQSGDYLDSLVRTAADFYEPYAKNFIMLGQGNHESAIRRIHETDISERLAQTLRDRTGAHCFTTGYSGWVKFMMNYHGARTSVTLWHHHGYGGGGPVTSDTIQAQRQRAYVDGADVMWSGHTHDQWAKCDSKLFLSPAGEVKQRDVWYVKSPTYKNEYATGKGGWWVETGKIPKPLGAWWMKLSLNIVNVRGRETTRPAIELHAAN